jgi:hypothetical protein
MKENQVRIILSISISGTGSRAESGGHFHVNNFVELFDCSIFFFYLSNWYKSQNMQVKSFESYKFEKINVFEQNNNLHVIPVLEIMIYSSCFLTK